MKLRTGMLTGVCLLLALGFLVEVRGVPLSRKQSLLPPAITLQPGIVIRHVKVTAYCPCEKCCGKGAKGLTATGRNAWKTRGVAVDFRAIPKRAVLELPGVGQLVADDTGGAMRQDAENGVYHIDLRFHSHQEALEWGVQWMDVRIISL